MARVRFLGREAAFFLFFFTAAVAITWPLATHITTAVPDAGDPLLNTWIVDWVCHALSHDPGHLFQAPMYYPGLDPLAYSENLIGIALIALPFHLAGLTPLALYNLMMLLGFAHAGYGAFVLGRMVSRSAFGGIVAGIFFAFVSFKFDHLSHLQIIWSGWLPLLLAALLAFWRRPNRLRAFALFAVFVMNGLTNIHFLLFGAFGIGVAIVLLAIAEPRRDWRTWVGLTLALGLGALVLLPVLQPYRAVAAYYGMQRIPEEVRAYSASWDDWLRVTSRSALYGRFMNPGLARAERVLFPGALVLVLTAYAVLVTPRRGRGASSGPNVPPWVLRILDTGIGLCISAAWIGAVTTRWKFQMGSRTIFAADNSAWPLVLALMLTLVRLALRLPAAYSNGDPRCLRDVLRDSRFPPALWIAALWIVVGILGSFGLNAFFHSFLFANVEAYRAIRAVARWAIMSYVGFAMWGAVGAAAIVDRRPRRWRPAVGAILLVLAFGDVAARIRWEQMVPAVPPVYRWLNQERVGPVLELPMHDDDSVEFRYLLYSTAHHVPLLNGTSGFEPPVHQQLRLAIESGRVDGKFTRTLEQVGCRLVIVHVDRLQLQTPAILTWLKAETEAGRLAPLRRFDSGMSGDYVLAVVKNLPDWSRFVDSGYDGAGHQPGQNFGRMLRGEKTYTSSTFGRLEMPRSYDTVHRQMRISGWALSPNGIRRVDVLLHGGKLRYATTLYERGDVTSAFPWYPLVTKPGFVADIPKRPKGIPRETDIQIEITDGSGRVTRLPDTMLTWH